jgi:lysyl-tRNA synthetase class I
MVTWDEINTIMQNMGGEQLDQESFQQAYDTDERIKNAIERFDPDGIYFSSAPEPAGAETDADNTVDAMADRATKKAMS